MKFRRHALLPAAVFMIGLGSAKVLAQTAGQFQDFTLVLETPQTKYVEFQPIPLVITLKNATQKPLVGHSVLEFGASYLHLYIDTPDGPKEVPSSLMTLDVYGSARVFQPGEQIKETASLNFRLDKTFPNPGTYRLHVRFKSLDYKDTVTSKPIDLEIVKPDGLDAQALQFIRDHSDTTYFFTGRRAVKDAEQLKVLETFVAEYGDSSYGDDALFTLAEVQFALRDHAKARTNFEKLLKKPDYVFAAEVSDFLKMIEERTRVAERP
jgi:hypothetical protein